MIVCNAQVTNMKNLGEMEGPRFCVRAQARLIHVSVFLLFRSKSPTHVSLHIAPFSQILLYSTKSRFRFLDGVDPGSYLGVDGTCTPSAFPLLFSARFLPRMNAS